MDGELLAPTEISAATADYKVLSLLISGATRYYNTSPGHTSFHKIHFCCYLIHPPEMLGSMICSENNTKNFDSGTTVL
jgi:hypothetical protein